MISFWKHWRPLCAGVVKSSSSRTLHVVDFARVDVEEERAGRGEDADRFDEARAEEREKVGRTCRRRTAQGRADLFRAVARSGESGAVALRVADGFEARALLCGAGVEGWVDVDELDRRRWTAARAALAGCPMSRMVQVGIRFEFKSSDKIQRQRKLQKKGRAVSWLRHSKKPEDTLALASGSDGRWRHKDGLMEKLQTLGVVGAGTMGNGIAHVFARAGFSSDAADGMRAAMLWRAGWRRCGPTWTARRRRARLIPRRCRCDPCAHSRRPCDWAICAIAGSWLRRRRSAWRSS